MTSFLQREYSETVGTRGIIITAAPLSLLKPLSFVFSKSPYLRPTQSNTKIMIRGKGATKEGKFGRFGLPQPGEDEELHALITGSSPEVVKLAVDKV